jgi:hypothetical protein
VRAVRATADFRLYRLSFAAFCVVACAIFVAPFYVRSLPFGMAALPAAGAVFCACRIPAARRRYLRFDSLARYYESGLARLGREWDSLDEGAEFAGREHEYANDLGLFGRGSLFQLLCSARTQGGRETLARWMKTPADAAEILLRQEAVTELRGRQDLRERMASAAPARISDYHPGIFRNWLSEPRIFRTWLGVPAFVFPLALPAIFVLLWTGLLGRDHLNRALLGWATLQALFYSVLHRRVRFVVDSMGLPAAELPRPNWWMWRPASASPPSVYANYAYWSACWTSGDGRDSCRFRIASSGALSSRWRLSAGAGAKEPGCRGGWRRSASSRR